MIPDSPSSPLSRSIWLVAIPMILRGVTPKEIDRMLYDDEALISLLYGKSRRGISGPKFPSLSPRQTGYLCSRAVCLSSQKKERLSFFFELVKFIGRVI